MLYSLREDADPSLILSFALEIHFVNMVKWRKRREKDLADPLNRWLTWFNAKSPPELVEEVASMDSAIMAAQNKYFGFAMQEEFDEWDYKRRRDKWEQDKVSAIGHARREGEEIGRQKGQEIGREEKAIEIARNALAEGATSEFVRKITGLDVETIKGLNR